MVKSSPGIIIVAKRIANNVSLPLNSKRANANADNTVITMYISNCFVELDGSNLEVMIIGSNNNISGIAEGITVFARGKKNEFHNRDEAPEADPSKNDN